MNTAQLTPRALDVIADSGECTDPVFRARPGAITQPKKRLLDARYADAEIRDADGNLLAVVQSGPEQSRILAAIAATAATGEPS